MEIREFFQSRDSFLVTKIFWTFGILLVKLQNGGADSGQNLKVLSVGNYSSEVAELPSSLLSQQKLGNLNISMFISDDRAARQLAILDQLSCLSKVICGMNTRSPSSTSNIINDYAYIINLLFDRDEDDDDEAGDEDADNGTEDEYYYDDDDDEEGRSTLKKGALRSKVKAKDKPKDKPKDDLEVEVKTLEEIVEDELMDSEPELLHFVLADIRQRTNKKKKQKKNKSKGPRPTRKPKPQNPRHSLQKSHYSPSFFPATYDYNSYYPTYSQNPEPLHYPSPTTLKPAWEVSVGPVGNGKRVKLRNKGFEVELSNEKKPKPSILGYLSQRFRPKVQVAKGPGVLQIHHNYPQPYPSHYPTHNPHHHHGDDFDADPFFHGFKRSFQTQSHQVYEADAKSSGVKNDQGHDKQLGQRTNSKLTKFSNLPERSARRCRLLFAKCPYEFDEIKAMIDSVKKLANQNKQNEKKKNKTKTKTKNRPKNEEARSSKE